MARGPFLEEASDECHDFGESRFEVVAADSDDVPALCVEPTRSLDVALPLCPVNAVLVAVIFDVDLCPAIGQIEDSPEPSVVVKDLVLNLWLRQSSLNESDAKNGFGRGVNAFARE
nr:hypothetical protein [Pseudoclavibacter alba]